MRWSQKTMILAVIFIIVTAFTIEQPTDLVKKISSRFLLKLATYPQEKVYLQTDKPHYVAGEKVWFRAYLLNAITHTFSNQSRYVYVELVNREDSVLQRVKIARRDSVFQGYLPLSLSIKPDDYMIRAYSYAMQNLGDDYLFKKQIRVLNVRKATEEPFLTEKNEKREKEVDNTVSGKAIYDVDVSFFPEGGELLAGNLQIVAFKAIDHRGMPVEIFGTVVNNNGDTVSNIMTQHDGMGRFRLPVHSDEVYTAVIKTNSGFEKTVNLPQVKDQGIGVKLVANDSVIKYAVVKGKKTVVNDELYVMIHTRGFVYSILPVNKYPVAAIPVQNMLEGIAHIVLFDKEYNVMSQRLCFVRRKDKPQLMITHDKKDYYHREQVHLQLGYGESIRSKLEGSFSVVVTSDRKVDAGMGHTNILTDLLLISDLKGYIESPDYYFDENNSLADRHLDLVMLTHGWTRFDVSKEMKGEVTPDEFYVEKGQVIAGKVKNFSGKKTAKAQLLILSSAGHVQMVEADSSGHFILEGIEYQDSTVFVIQATKEKGGRSVEVLEVKDKFIPASTFFPFYFDQKEEYADFLRKYGQNYYYENGQKVYLLDEAIVKRNMNKKYYSPAERQAYARLDSAEIAELKDLDIRQVIERLRGLQVENNCVTIMGRDTVTVFINELPIVDFSEVTLLQPAFVWSISWLRYEDAFIFYGDRVGRGGALCITVDPARRIIGHNHPSLAMFTPLGIQKPAEFYAPKYERGNTTASSNERDERATVYWNPVVNITKDKVTHLSFFTADLSGNYTVTVEGVTTGGEAIHKKIKLQVK